jgi:uncharacterized membrane protein YphA (DoxX/SURF4 family)
MSIAAKLRRAPTRLATGAYILNSGIGKLTGDDDTAKAIHGMTTGAYPAFEKLEPKLFLRTLAVGEVALGSALLLPVVPAAVAGAGLVAFSGALLGLYWRLPGMHHDGSPRPTQQGTAISKDVWMFGIGAGLIADAATSRLHDKLLDRHGRHGQDS